MREKWRALALTLSAGILGASGAQAQECDLTRDPEQIQFTSPAFFLDGNTAPLAEARGRVDAVPGSAGCTVSLTEQTNSLPLLFEVTQRANDGSAVRYIARDNGDDGLCGADLRAGRTCIVVGNAVFEGPAIGTPPTEIRPARVIRTTVVAILTLVPQPGIVVGGSR